MDRQILSLSQPIIDAKLPNYNNKIYTVVTPMGYYFITTDLTSRYASLFVECATPPGGGSLFVAPYTLIALHLFNQRNFGIACGKDIYDKLAMFEDAGEPDASMSFHIKSGDKVLFTLNNFIEQQNFNDPTRPRPFANYACFDAKHNTIVATNGELMQTLEMFTAKCTMPRTQRILISKDLLVAMLRYMQQYPSAEFDVTVSVKGIFNNVYTVMLEVNNLLFAARQSITVYPDWKHAVDRYKQPDGSFDNHLLLEARPPVLPEGENLEMDLNEILENHLHIPTNTKCNPVFNKKLFWFCMRQLIVYQGSEIEYVPNYAYPVKFKNQYPDYRQTIYLMPMGQLTKEAQKRREEEDEISASRLI